MKNLTSLLAIQNYVVPINPQKVKLVPRISEAFDRQHPKSDKKNGKCKCEFSRMTTLISAAKKKGRET